jgi:hypothetical protein
VTGRITNHDIVKLRELAAQRVWQGDAPRLTGLSRGAIDYWNRKANIGLMPRYNRRIPPHPAPDILACWRLHLTMARLVRAARGDRL